MPTFDFKCPKCEKVREELIRKPEDELLVTCEDCGFIMRKQIGAPNVEFKGFGFPDNDRRLFKTPPDAKEKLKAAGLRETKK